MNVETSWARIAARAIMQEVAHTVYMGDTDTEFSGLFSKAHFTSTDATAKWNAALGPPGTVSDMLFNASSLIWSAGFRPPYILVLSDNLKKGLTVYINAAPVSDITNGEMVLNYINGNKSGDASNLFFEDIGTNVPDGTTIYPFETATSNDGRALLLKPVQDGVTYISGRWMERPHTTDWTFDDKTDRWHTRIKAMIALQVRDTSAIVGHTTVDLA
jgi:hypothetical protein